MKWWRLPVIIPIVSMTSLHKHASPYRLLKEARKSWQHFVSDQVMYLAKSKHGQRPTLPDRNDDAAIYSWFEIDLHFREGLAVFIVESPQHSCAPAWDAGEGNLPAGRRDNPVLIMATEQLKCSQQVEFRPIRSMIRLKFFNHGVSRGWEVMDSTSRQTANDRVPVRLGFERKIDLAFLMFGQRFAGIFNSLHGQSPCDMVEAGSQISDNVTDHKPPTFPTTRSTENDPAFRLVALPGGDVVFQAAPDAPFKSADVYERPADFSLGTAERMIGWEILSHERTEEAENPTGHEIPVPKQITYTVKG